MTVVPQIAMSMFEARNIDWISTSVDAIVVQNKWYTPLPLARNPKTYYMRVEQTNNGATAEDLEVELTVNGVIHTLAIAFNSGTFQWIIFNANGTISVSAGTLQMRSIDADQSAPLETRSLLVRVRQTSAVDGVAANIETNIIYATSELAA